MEKGDLSNRAAPRWIVQFEGVVADVPDEESGRWKRAVALGRWRRAAGCYALHERASHILNDLYWQQDYRFDVVTFLGGPAFAEAVAWVLDRNDLPVANVFFDEPEHLARELVFRPSVVRVVHALPSHALTFGSVGLLVNDPDSMRRL